MRRQKETRGAGDAPGQKQDRAGRPTASTGSTAQGRKQLRLGNGLANQPRWVAWRQETVKGKPTKVPYSPSGVKARIPSDPSTWGTRKEVERRWNKLKRAGRPGGIGLVLGDFERAKINARLREEAALRAWDEVTYVPPPPRPTVIKRSDLGQANTYSPLSPELVAALQSAQQQQLEAVMEAEIDEDDLECLLLAL